MEYCSILGYKISRMILGTAQLGMKYGIANVTGQLSDNEVFHVLNESIKYGINTFDTAQEYGRSEELLGTFFKTRAPKDKIQIITKLTPSIAEEKNTQNLKESITSSVQTSLLKLGVKKLPFLLLHRPYQLQNKKILSYLQILQEQEKIDHIGVSVYTPQEAQLGLDKDEITCIEVPFNVFDNRLIDIDFFAQAKALDKVVLVRSVFLQGVVLMDNSKIPKNLKEILTYKETLAKISFKAKRSIIQIALKYPLSFEGVTGIIVGVDNAHHLSENLREFESPPLRQEIIEAIQMEFGSIPDRLIDPRNW